MENKPSLISKGRYELKYRGTKCLNCGHVLDISDKYCPNCSQANSTKKLILKDFFDEFFSSLLNYDSKLLKTLYTLLARPGTITKDYIKGKRISYTNPFRFLLSLAFIYLLMFSYDNSFSELDRTAKGLGQKIQQGDSFSLDIKSGSVFKNDAEITKQTEKTLHQIDSINRGGGNIPQRTAIMDSLGIFGDQGKIVDKDSLMLADPGRYLDSTSNKETGFERIFNKVDFFTKIIKKDSVFTFSHAKKRYQIQETKGNKMAFNVANSLLRVVARPGSFLNATIAKMPFVVFLFLPLFTIFIWLVYIRKKHTYTDHLIFSFHNQSLLFILLILSLIIDAMFNTASAGLFLLVFGFYLYKAMRRFYGQGRFKTIVKYIFLNTIFAFLAFFVVLTLFTGSALTY